MKYSELIDKRILHTVHEQFISTVQFIEIITVGCFYNGQFQLTISVLIFKCCS
jgi:hypothetical protein